MAPTPASASRPPRSRLPRLRAPRLDFDFHARPARPGALGIALALVGGAALIWAWSALQEARATHASLAGEIAALEQKPRVAPKPVARGDSAAQIARARIASQLRHSWQSAFEALAAARSGKIALVSLEASQAKEQMKLVAEARQLADAIGFIETLQQQPGVRRVTLVQHAIQADAEQKPVRFNILVELDPRGAGA
jgi:nitrate reductase NapAB chaperone NapD